MTPSSNDQALFDQADLFSKYLIGLPPCLKVRTQYSRLIRLNDNKLSNYDYNVLEFTLNHPHLIAPLDSGLALIKPNSELRRRIYYAFALLESQPEFSNDFLPTQSNATYLIVILFESIKFAIFCIFGIILIKFFINKK
jgi:hypothetical protein